MRLTIRNTTQGGSE